MRIVIIFLFLVPFSFVRAQTGSFGGSVRDTTEKKTLQYSSVSLLRASDSTFISSVRTNSKGEFQFNTLPQGKLLLLVTYPNYADFLMEVEAKTWTTPLIVAMISRQQLLEQVVFLQKLGPMRMKKDTLEYIADSFKLKTNATVEDLLRRLPGVYVNPDGSISVQGESVSRVLVDGEEFFGNDPTIATKNLKAEYVEKIQVYDKKSDAAVFSGVDDGIKEKTVNIKLKKNKNTGYIGKIGAGYGLDDRKSGQAMVLNMKGRRRIGVIATYSNNTVLISTWDDMDKYGGDGAVALGEMRSLNIFTYSNGNIGTQYGAGYPSNFSLAGQVANAWNNDSLKLNSEFRQRNNYSNGNGSIITQYLLSDSSLTRSDSGSNFMDAATQSVRFRLTNQANQSSEWRFYGRFFRSKEKQGLENVTVNQNARNEVVSENKTRNNNLDESYFSSFQVANFKRYKRPGSTLVFGAALNLSSGTGTQQLNSLLKTFQNGGAMQEDSIRQESAVGNKRTEFVTKLNLNRLLRKALTISWSSLAGYMEANSSRMAYAFENSSSPKFVDSLSSNVDYNAVLLKNSAELSYETKKFSLSLVLGATTVDLRQSNKLNATRLNTVQTGFTPSVFGTYKTKIGTFELNYRVTQTLPSINQMLPVLVNTDPYNRLVGNLGLKQRLLHAISLKWDKRRLLNAQFYSSQVSFELPLNDFSTAETVTSDGIRTYQTINVNGNKSISYFLNANLPLKKDKVSIRGTVWYTYFFRYNYVNGALNQSRTQTLVYRTSLQASLLKKVLISANYQLGYNKTLASINKLISNSFWRHSVDLNLDIEITKKINTSVSYTGEFWRPSGFYSKGTQIHTLNASCTLNAFKDNRGRFVFSAQDIFNQNKAVTRTLNGNTAIESRVQRMGRVLLLQFLWSFDKMGGAKE